MQPSMRQCGSAIISGMSLQVPGSPSSALMTRYFGLNCGASFVASVGSSPGLGCGMKRPLHARREARAAAAAQPGVLDEA